MPITINGSGTVTGISAGGLPDDCITTADIAAGAVTQAKRSEQLTLATAQASTSGTFIDFTGIPSWVKRITVLIRSCSTSGSSDAMIQLGTSSGFVTSGYAGSIYYSTTGTLYNTGFEVTQDIGSASTFGTIAYITLLGSNTWCMSGSGHGDAVNKANYFSGSVSLSGTLDRVRVTTVNGTDTFDAGSINILYE